MQTLVLGSAAIVWATLAGRVDLDPRLPEPRPWGFFQWSDFSTVLGHNRSVLQLSAFLIAFTLGQALIVMPVRRPRFRSERGAPLMLSLSVMALCIALLIGSFLVALAYVFNLNANDVPAIISLKATWSGPVVLSMGGPEALLVGLAVLFSWTIAGILLQRFARRRLAAGDRHEDVLSQIAARIFLGTIIEVVAIIPLDAMTRRRDSCYCLAGTFFVFCVAGSVGLLVLGPLILLPVLARRRKRWYAQRCDACGYDLSTQLTTTTASKLPRCPECGAGWKPDPGAAA